MIFFCACSDRSITATIHVLNAFLSSSVTRECSGRLCPAPSSASHLKRRERRKTLCLQIAILRGIFPTYSDHSESNLVCFLPFHSESLSRFLGLGVHLPDSLTSVDFEALTGTACQVWASDGILKIICTSTYYIRTLHCIGRCGI